MATAESALNEPLIGGRTEEQIRAALQQAAPNALRLALYQATRDPELASMEVVKLPFWGGAFLISEVGEEDAVKVREKALAFLKGGGSGKQSPSPDDGELRRMMEMFQGGNPVTDFHFEVGRGDIVDEEFPLGVKWSNEPSAEVKQKYFVVVIGAGLAGMASSIQLNQLGINHVVIERNSKVGGTWWVNDYPDARVDIASHHYQYSFMKHYPWKHYFATQQELLDYAEATAERYDLKRNIRFDTSVVAADWDEQASLWRVRIRSAEGVEEVINANALISAAGLFNAPNLLPDIPGIESFQGKMFHTTRWDHSYDYAGKRIGQIGVGSTGAQLMPEVARTAAQVTVYQRSPQWVSEIEGYRDSISPEVQWLFDYFPNYWAWYSYFIFAVNMGGDPEGLQNVDHEWRAKGGRISKRNDGLRAHNIEYIRSKVGHDPELMRKLTPDFPPFAKRPVVDNGWFDALNRPNVELVTEPIERITPKGILTEDGREREFDLIVLGLGFKTERYLWPVAYRGRNGVTLEDAWNSDGPRSYLGMTVSGFPNLFIIYGPNGQARSGGLIKWIEIWSRYAVKSVVAMIENGISSMEVRRDVSDDYNAKMDEALKDCVWGMDGSKSYYVSDDGRQYVNMPWKPADYYKWIREPDLTKYELK